MSLLLTARRHAAVLIQAARDRAAAQGALPAACEMPVVINIPADIARGDLSTPFALAAAPCFGMRPCDVAAILAAQLRLDGTFFRAASPTAQGIINFTLGSRFHAAVLAGYERADSAAAPPRPVPPHWAACALGISPRAAHFLRCAGLPQDSDLATRRDCANPLYRIAYAHARACALVARAAPLPCARDAAAMLPDSRPVRRLLRTLGHTPAVDERPMQDGGLQVARHLIALADDFFALYHAAEDRTPAWLKLADATAAAIETGLDKLGLSVPPPS